jgi:isochorismate pyruvate lyase
MTNRVKCNSLKEVRSNIDHIDRAIVGLLVERIEFVRYAARFKKNLEDIRAPIRMEEIIAKVRAASVELGTDPAPIERVFQSIMNELFKLEHQAFLAMNGDKS